ncbi:MAG: orotate phosphoribosyltransferase [Elusimicrobia bacterium]|nr:orotate phosphoribosyltransferase [Elusimicrobiota bacterium]
MEVSLSSGGKSNYYIDGKLVTLSPKGSYLLAAYIFSTLEDEIRAQKIDAIGGLTLGADPIVSAVILISFIRKYPIKGFIVRKEPKKHGKQLMIEGPLQAKERVVIVEDVTTKGKSVLKAIEEVEKIGCRVVKIISLVDRLEGAAEEFSQKGYKFEPLFTRKDLE